MGMSYPAGQRTDGRAIAALAFGCAGFVIFPVVPSIIAIWLGVASRRAIRRDPSLSGDWMATTGVVLGVLGLLFATAALFLFFSIVASDPATPHSSSPSRGNCARW